MPDRLPPLPSALGLLTSLTLAALVGCGGEGGTDSGSSTPSAGTGAGSNTGPAAPDPDAAARAVASEIEQATAAFRQAVLSESVGLGRVSDLGLSDDLVARATDRIFSQTFHDQLHAIYPDREADPAVEDIPPPPPSRVVSFVLEPHFVPDDVMTGRETARTARPANRGWRPPRTVGAPGEAVPPPAPESRPLDVAASGAWLPAAELIARRLAGDGLAATTIRALSVARGELPGGSDETRVAAALAGLRGVGLPVDLLTFVAPLDSDGPAGSLADDDDAREDDASRWIAAALRRLDAGERPEELAERAGELETTIRPSIPGFRAALDDGEDPLGHLRLQPTRGTYWAGRGGGGSLDFAVSTMEALPDVAFTVSIGRPFVDDALKRISPAREGARGAVAIVDEPHVIAQWAQDNGQPGFVGTDPSPWLLAPRYASRGDLGSTIDPGETWMVEGLPAAGIGVARSPLLFQGGNLLLVNDPVDGGRLLLLGDAEVERNVSLGLDRATITEGFRVEFAADRVAVLAPPAFHLDFATTIRRVTSDGATRSVAFVHDEETAFDLLLEAGIGRLARAGVIRGPLVRELRDTLASGEDQSFVELLGPPLYAAQRADGMWPLTLTDEFGDRAGLEGIAVFDRFLCAFERLMARSLELRRVPGPPEVRVYLAGWERRAATIEAFDAALAELGFDVVPIPGFSLQRRSVNTVNMVHGRDRILRPVTGGTLAPIDAAAGAAIAAVVGPRVRLIDLPTAETQRRSGAVGCAVAAWPLPPRTASGPALP